MTGVRVAVADPLRIFRVGVRNLLARESDFEVFEAASLDELVELTEVVPLDIALVDLDLPPLGGIGAIEELRECCDAHLIVWSLQPSSDAVLQAIRAGADGCVHKEISPPGLVRALRGVVHGEAPLARDLVTLMVDELHRFEQRTQALERAAALSTREHEVLELIAGGARNRDIAAELEISEFTVKRHVQNILRKLDLPSRRSAAALHRAAFVDRAPPGKTAVPA